MSKISLGEVMRKDLKLILKIFQIVIREYEKSVSSWLMVKALVMVVLCLFLWIVWTDQLHLQLLVDIDPESGLI